MNRMRWLVIFPLFFLFSCSGNKKELKVSEKDIEGYWVSGYLLHNTELSREIASGNDKKPKRQMLRLKNEVNGFADTAYEIHGDTLLYRIGIKRLYKPDGMVEVDEFYPFRIVFYSKDRIVLVDDAKHEETTFYNLSILPAQPDTFTEIKLGENKIIINDSTKFYGAVGCSYGVTALLLNMKTDDAWKSNLDSIISKVNWKGAVFATGSDNFKEQSITKYPNELNIPVPLPPSSKLQVRTQKHLGIWQFVNPTVSDPALSVLITELNAFETYCRNHDVLRQ